MKECKDCCHFHDLEVYDERGNLIHTEVHFITRHGIAGNETFYWATYSPCCEYCEKLVKRMKDIER